MTRLNTIRSLLVGSALLLLLSACSGLRYEPVQELSFARVLERDCGEEGERITTRARINRVYRNSLILWDGRDPASTYTVALVEPSFGQRLKAKVGTSRFERAYEVLKQLEEERVPIEVVLTCARGDRPPTADRFSYTTATGERRTFELARK